MEGREGGSLSTQMADRRNARLFSRPVGAHSRRTLPMATKPMLSSVNSVDSILIATDGHRGNTERPHAPNETARAIS